ncbi:MAG: gliding motility-associated C-terminal domain-containing protein [Bacteroidales bacterium]|nr:gliding motility-associated C-terminal domain-containing protein [Bacteroidales bacterium]
MKRDRRHIIFCLILCLLPLAMKGQRIIELHLERNQCAGSEQTVTFGLRRTNTVVVSNQNATLGHSEQIFLPDGVECNGSCSYRSPVTFSEFDPSACITSAEDIKYVRIKMEHSYIGDIYINITCPNGRKADIMRYAGTGTSACDDAIPSESVGWLYGDNLSEGFYFGEANDRENENQPCDANASGNEPGVGWNYCWSSNTTSGYGYAAGDGIVYRAPNGNVNSNIIDSSNVAAKTHFYHPDQNFTRLVGCPLNGTWYIEVVDGYSIDNGYIFEWSLSLDASLIDTCRAESYLVMGGPTEQVNDSTFRLIAPDHVLHDSTVNYRFIVVSSCGDTIDTTAAIVYHPNLQGDTIDTAVCESLRWGSRIFDRDTMFSFNAVSQWGCDSIGTMNLTVYPSYKQHFYDTVCVNEPCLFEGETYYGHGTYTHRLPTIHGCDSLLILHLHVLSEEMRAGIKAIPLIVTSESPYIELYDASRHHDWSEWQMGGEEQRATHLTYRYPTEKDSAVIVLVAYSYEGCSDTASVTARIDRTMVTVPNVFTPNLERNKVWRPALLDVSEMEVWIYSRQGNLVAHLEGTEAYWDGRNLDGTPCPQGNYVYQMRYRSTLRPERVLTKSGNIMMIR